MKTVNIKADRPSVAEALSRLDRELKLARREGVSVMKIVHGYGSSGAGGDIRIAVQKRLRELAKSADIQNCIFGEAWAKSDDTTWDLLQAQPGLKSDPDLGRRNEGITIVLINR